MKKQMNEKETIKYIIEDIQERLEILKIKLDKK